MYDAYIILKRINETDGESAKRSTKQIDTWSLLDQHCQHEAPRQALQLQRVFASPKFS